MPVSPPASLAAIGARVAARIDGLLAAEQDRWAAVSDAMAEPYAALRRLIAGGKRLRPAFCHWGFVGAGGAPSDPRIVDAGAGLELLHTFALVHDDIMDGSLRRHGVPALHVDFAERFASRGWAGEARRFGDGAALLIGDLAFVYADLLLAGAPPAALEVFTEMRLEVNVGQYLDLVGTAARTADVEAARTICAYKSGKYTIERPLHLGAALAGGLDELAKAFTGYGIPLGEAFQLRDDLLGAFGDPALLGKEVGDDLRSGKPTALYALARSSCSVAAGSLLDRSYGRADLTAAEIEAVLDVFESTGARAEVSARIDSLMDQALGALADAPLAGGARDELIALAGFVAGRDF